MYVMIDADKTAENIRRLTYKNNLSAKELAIELNVTQMCIYNWLLGNNLPSIENLISLSILFSVSINEIVAYELN